MTCRRARKLFQALLDNDLSEASSPDLRGHLDTCPPCRAEYEALARLDAALSDEPTVDAPPQMASAIARRAAARYLTAKRLLIPAWLEALTLGGTTVALGAGGFLAVSALSAAVRLQFSPAMTISAVATIVAIGLAAYGSAFYRAEV